MQNMEFVPDCGIGAVSEIPAVSTRALQPKQNLRIKGILTDIVRVRFSGNQKACADRLGVSPSMISEVLQGRRGAGSKLLESLANFTGRSVDDLLGRSVVVDTAEVRDRTSIRSHPDFDAVYAEFVEEFGSKYSMEAVEEGKTASFAHGPPEYLTVDFFRRIVDAIDRARADAEQRKHRK